MVEEIIVNTPFGIVNLEMKGFEVEFYKIARSFTIGDRIITLQWRI